MAFFKKDGYMYTKMCRRTDRKEFMVKYKTDSIGYILQKIGSINVPVELVGKKVRIKMEVVDDNKSS